MKKKRSSADHTREGIGHGLQDSTQLVLLEFCNASGPPHIYNSHLYSLHFTRASTELHARKRILLLFSV
jgi:hypothetical protein